MDAKELREKLIEQGVPKAIVDNIRDEDLEAVASMAKKAVNDTNSCSVKQVEKGFEVETEFFKMMVPLEHMAFFAAMLTAMSKTVVDHWENLSETEKRRVPGGPVSIAGAVLGQTTETVLDYLHANEDLMQELMINDAMTQSAKKKQTDSMYF